MPDGTADMTVGLVHRAQLSVHIVVVMFAAASCARTATSAAVWTHWMPFVQKPPMGTVKVAVLVGVAAAVADSEKHTELEAAEAEAEVEAGDG